MLTLFTWTPHHDHRETGRYRNTRVSIWPGGNSLLLGQGFHLIHQMIPSIPYYRYESTFREMRPLLERQEAVEHRGLLARRASRAIAPPLRTSIEKIRRQDLVRAAYSTFLEHGLSGMTMARIGARAGMSHGIVNYYLKGKAELLDGRRAPRQLPDHAGGGGPAAPRADAAGAAVGHRRRQLPRRALRPQRNGRAWTSFYAAVPNRREFGRLQSAVYRRLRSNLIHDLARLVDRPQGRGDRPGGKRLDRRALAAARHGARGADGGTGDPRRQRLYRSMPGRRGPGAQDPGPVGKRGRGAGRRIAERSNRNDEDACRRRDGPWDPKFWS